jgi:hypothetical protein
LAHVLIQSSAKLQAAPIPSPAYAIRILMEWIAVACSCPHARPACKAWLRGEKKTMVR